MPKAAAQEARLTLVLAADSAEGDGPVWIEIMPTGDSLKNGPWFFTITREDLETYAQSIRDAAPESIVIDYDHEGDVGRSTRAAGWFTGQAEVRDTDDGPRLYAEVDWTPRARQEIRDGEYRKFSPVFDFAKKDKKSGLMTKAKQIVAGTLTNRPFFKELPPVLAAEVVWEPEQGLNYLRDRVYAALNPGPLDNAKYWVVDISTGGDRALVQEYGDGRTWVVPFTIADGEVQIGERIDWIQAEQEWVTAAVAAEQSNRRRKPFTPQGAEMDLKVIAKSLGLNEDASEEEVTAALAAQAEKAAEADELKVRLEEQGDESELAKAQARIAALETSRRESEINAILATAVSERKILPVQKDGLKATAMLGDAAFENVKATLDATPKGTFNTRGGDGSTKDETVDDAVVVEARERFAPKDDDADVPDEQLKAHVRAEAILAEKGKGDSYSTAEYVVAYAQAEREIASA
jgi:phage I-like protein